jgi:hypothetical protein
LWFSPYGRELAIPLLPPLLLLIFLTADDLLGKAERPERARRTAATISAMVLTALFVGNFLSVIRPRHAGYGPDFETARGIHEIAPADAVLITGWEVQENLRYHFGRTELAESDVVLFSFFRGLELPTDSPYRGGGTVVVPLRLARPDIRPLKAFGAETHPREWLVYLAWLLGFETREGRVVSVRAPIVAAGGGEDLLILGPGRVEVEGLAGLARLLDGILRESLGIGSSPFERWLEAHPETGR